MSNPTTRPASLFIDHISPLVCLEDKDYSDFLRKWGESVRPGLKAIVIFSAHYKSNSIIISSSDGPYSTMYDYGPGFPDKYYTMKYPVCGSSKVAAQVKNLLEKAGFSCAFEKSRGLDHGSWPVLMHMFPQREVPVVQVSLVTALPPAKLMRIGAALRGLHREGVLVIGSGALIHNMQEMDFQATEPPKWAIELYT